MQNFVLVRNIIGTLLLKGLTYLIHYLASFLYHVQIKLSATNVVEIITPRQIVRQLNDGLQNVQMTVKQQIIFQLIQRT